MRRYIVRGYEVGYLQTTHYHTTPETRNTLPTGIPLCLLVVVLVLVCGTQVCTTSLATGPATSTRTKVECRCKEHILHTHRDREYHTYRYSLLSTVVLGIAWKCTAHVGSMATYSRSAGVLAASLHTTVLRILRANGTYLWYHV